MSQFLEVNGKKYTYTKNVRDNAPVRNSFNELAKAVHGIDFEQWYQKGYWKDQYIPYSLLDGDTVVANVSVNLMDFLVMGEKKRYIQIGTVMTAPEYRMQGLSRALIERILSEWENESACIYLFANDTVLDFYPKFGFAPIKEYQCSKVVTKKQKASAAKKLDMTDAKDESLLFRAACDTLPFSAIAMRNNPALVMFYGISFLKDNVYYIPDYDAVAIAEYNGSSLYLQDVFCARNIELDFIIDALITEETTRVELGFTPKDTSSYKMDVCQDHDTLFVRSKSTKPFDLKDFMFPVLSHA
jgi:predicted N-acetyltransferase YhbS